jgi:hypothetical protein
LDAALLEASACLVELRSIVKGDLRPLVMRDERSRVADARNQVNIPPVQDAQMNEGHHLSGLILQAQVSGSLVQQSMVAVGLP